MAVAAAVLHTSQPHGDLPHISSAQPHSRSHGHRQQALACLQPPIPTEIRRQRQQQKPNLTLNVPSAFSHILHLNLGAHHDRRTASADTHPLQRPKSTPTSSPKEDISSMWRELHGSRDWAGLLDPLHPWFRREVVKYGELAQATYDAFDADDRSSRYCGSCRFGRSRLLRQLGLAHTGYEATKYVYAMSHVELPRWLERSLHAETWSRDSNWMGYVAVSGDEETHRIGRRDILVAWRGTVTPAEWFEDVQRRLEPLHSHNEEHHHHYNHRNDVAKVEHGFHSIYTSRSESTRYNKTSASEQVMEEIRRLVKFYSDRGEEVSLTITGHSLGGALALLNAHDAAAAAIPGLSHVSVVSFGAPRVGNAAFGRELDELGVKVLRVVNKQDMVPHLPGALFNEELGRFLPVEGLDWVYTHAGVELEVDVRASPYLKHGGFDLAGFHSLETYMHLVDGFLSRAVGFRREARRDVALVNKACGLLREELSIPAFWYQAANKGLVRNAYGRWVVPERHPEDVPSPYGEMAASLLLSAN
ncbi:hypothetical protein Taro_048561 [Colocasia esculenta]|uniref:Fungal lipase-type domain-containing protein n=1 Tax=Colocasia esculenta TaxID=4460 RepID=A0A843X8F5_COLES|nr:hypothetical protein [Colocasia esculenta]